MTGQFSLNITSVEEDRSCEFRVGYRGRQQCINRAVFSIDGWVLCGEHGPQHVREVTREIKAFMEQVQEHWNTAHNGGRP